MSHLPTIAGVEIHLDAESRYNLNALHRAYEAEMGEAQAHKAPNQWLRVEAASAFVQAVAQQAANMQLGEKSATYEVVKVSHGGRSPGTFAHELIAVEYAGWLSPAFRIRVNQTFIDFRTGKLAVLPQVTSTIPPLQQAARMVPDLLIAAELFGFTGNQATLSANKAIHKFTGINLLEAMGTSLVAPEKEALLTPTDIATRLGAKPRSANPLLIECGLQEAHRDHKNKVYYEPTEAGKPYAVFLDTDKKHSDGAPVRQLKWRSGVLKLLPAAAGIPPHPPMNLLEDII